MKLYLSDKERSLDFLNLIEIMLRDGISSKVLDLPTTDTILNISGVEDPVLDFLNYYILDANLSDKFDEGRLYWVLNALYSAKGAPQIFEVFQESFGININYTYDFPVVDIINFGELLVTDVILFVNKFKSMIYHLLYYTELNLAIKDLILNLSSIVNRQDSVLVKGFSIHNPIESFNRL